MRIIRPITKKEEEIFIEFAFHIDQGMSSMPKNRERLLHILHQAEHSFQKEIITPGDEHYIFVLEDLQTGNIEGTCGIVAKTGLHDPLYFYHKEHMQRMDHEIPYLRMVHYFSQPSEIGSLFLIPEARHTGSGRLLSLSRFLFIAANPERFDPVVFAVMRGFFTENRISTFWNGIGRHFSHMEFNEIMKLQNESELDIPRFFPSFPVYLELLPKEVQESVSKVHTDSLPALNMLIQEGFQLTNEVDMIDGGPKIEAEVSQIRTIKDSIVAVVEEIVANVVDQRRYLICNNQLQFRACCSGIMCKKSKFSVAISEEAAFALQVKKGDMVRYVPAVGT